MSTMYTHILWGTLARREHLQAVKGFLCRCPRCADPRELGSMLSALRCPGCGAGCLLPADPLQDDADWRCDACAAPLAAEHVVQVRSTVKKNNKKTLCQVDQIWWPLHY